MTASVCQPANWKQTVLRTCVLLLTLALLALLLPTGAYAATITLAWDPPSENPQLVAGYLLYYGNVSGPPYEGTEANEGPSPIDVGNVTTFSFNGLDDTRDWFFAVTAYNKEGSESTYSNEASTSDVASDSGNSGSTPDGDSSSASGRGGSGCFIDAVKRNPTSGFAGSVILGIIGAAFLCVPGGTKRSNRGRNRAKRNARPQHLGTGPETYGIIKETISKVA
jgi:hypothetical protein